MIVLAVSLSAWAADDEFRPEPGDPGSPGVGSQNSRSHMDVTVEDLTEPGEPGAGSATYRSGGSYLGIDTQDITAERVAPLKLKEERGVEVVMVDQDAPAGKAGIKEHDVILEFNGARVEGVEQLRRMIHEVPAGRTVTLGLSRDGQPVNVPVQLADRTKEMTQIVIPSIRVNPQVRVSPMPEIAMPPENDMIIFRTGRSGLQVETLTPQLGEFFGIKDGKGILVRSVEKGSAAESAGLKAGDVIVRVENEKIANRGDWNMALRAHNSGKVTVGVVRDKREQSISLTLPGSKDRSGIWIPGEEFNWDDFDIEINQSELTRIKDEARKQAGLIRQQTDLMKEQIRKSTLQTKEELDRELKPQMEQLRHSLEQMQRSLHKAASEL
jgi:membrane-associated protease RseP (regulator of RpoE activity)